MIDSQPLENTGPQIKKLPQQLIDKIAAGEVVQRPSSAVKELIENCIDAGSSEISVGLVQGGLKQLIIEDNGTGIHKDDFPLLCQRFATSKIKEFNDLASLVSFGFRGEALASISFVSNLKIISRKPQSDLGYSASFKNGQMINSEPEAVSCQEGTIVDVQDLFSNYDIRRKSFNVADEKNKTLKLIGQFATHHSNLRFKFKSDNQIQFSTHNILGSTEVQRREKIMQQISKLSDKSFTSSQHESTEYKVQFKGTFSNIGSTKKHKDLVLFINNRLVECDSIKKAVERSYQACYQSVNEEEGGYFCYISINMNPKNIDPNVHPTKKEVKFLFEFELSKELEQWMFNLLKNCGIIKQFSESVVQKIQNYEAPSQKGSNKRNHSSLTNNQSTYYQPTKQIRVDPRDQKITRFFSADVEDKNISISENQSIQQNLNENNDEDEYYVPLDIIKKKRILNEERSQQQSDMSLNNINDNDRGYEEKNNLIQQINNRFPSTNINIQVSNVAPITQDPRVQIQQQLLILRNQNYHEQTTQFFKNLSYLGCISSNHFMAQFKDDLYLINSIPICQEIFNYEILRNFGQLKQQELRQSIDLKDLLEFFLNNFDDIPLERKQFHLEQMDNYIEQFSILGDFLRNSVGIVIKDNKLVSFPNLFNLFDNEENYKDISYTLLRIITKVNFDNLLQAGLDLANELSFYFSWKLEKSFKNQQQKQYFQETQQKKWDEFFEKVMLPLIKQKVTLPFLNVPDFVVKLFKQEEAYKIFERC